MSMSGAWGSGVSAYDAPLDARLAFIRKTYLHLAGAIVAFVILSTLLFYAGVGVVILRFLAAMPFAWLLFLGAFSLAGWLATSMAQSDRTMGAQYGGLALYTVAESIIFSPLITLAAVVPQFQGILPTAAGLT